MNEFLLYVALPTLVAIAGVSAFYAIKEGNKGHALAEDTRTQQHPAIVPIRDAEFYRVNGHWIFGVRGQEAALDDAEFAAIAGLGAMPSFYSARDEEEVMSGVRGGSVYGPYKCHAEHDTDCGV